MDNAAQKPTAQAGNPDFAQAFKDLTRGEQTASAMENKLSSLEQRIDDLLASVESRAEGTETTDGASHTNQKGTGN
ncbi:hypothetical protein MMC19_007001 [Ptychographa xylographoides]|nr:hypothetical protein [Ptychographa xylographoides]